MNAPDRPARTTVMDRGIAMFPLPTGAFLWTGGVQNKIKNFVLCRAANALCCEPLASIGSHRALPQGPACAVHPVGGPLSHAASVAGPRLQHLLFTAQRFRNLSPTAVSITTSPGLRLSESLTTCQIRYRSHCGIAVPPLEIPPPLATPPPLGGEGAKDNLYKAPKLIYTVILRYSFVVRPPPRGGGQLSLCDRPPPLGAEPA